jgi:hypothetical protein
MGFNPAGGFGVGADPGFCADVVANVYVFPFSDVIPPKKSLFGAYFQQGVLIGLLDRREDIES